MLAAATKLKHAQEVKTFLQKHNLLDTNFGAIKELGFIYFPMKEKAPVPHAKVTRTKFSFPQKEQPKTIKQLLKNKLTTKQLNSLPKSQEMVGSILILEIPEELQSKEKIIAQAYLESTAATTVVKKDKIHSGTFRTRKVKILAGKKTKETTHKESGLALTLHLEKAYFSARSGHERLRIAKQVKKGEEVLVMFSGIGPFALVIAKHTTAKHTTAVELNPLAHLYAVKNVEQNKLDKKVTLQEGDVYTVLPKLKKKFDRIVMPLPKTSEEFLPLAIKKAKKGAIIHLYAFLSEKEFAKERKKLRELCLPQKVRILRTVKCGQFSPSVFRVCFDIKIL